MKPYLSLVLLLSTLLSATTSFADAISCEDLYKDEAPATAVQDTSSAELITTNDHALPFTSEVILDNYKGQSFLTTMKTVIKPILDKFAKDGFVIADTSVVMAALDQVSSKVKAQALKAAGSEQNLQAVVDQLKGQKVTLYNLPEKIAATNVKIADKYGLNTFLALASGGGVVLRLCDGVCSFNVNYGAGDQDKDAQTGRSFAQGPTQAADDASDKTLLMGIQALVRTPGEDLGAFYETLSNIILNSDSSGVTTLSEQAKNILSEFMAVYVAEQDRHLMSDLKTHAWDVSELEVGLQSIFLEKLTTMMAMYHGKLVDQAPVQTPGGTGKTGAMAPVNNATYWQFSSKSNQSGINETQPDFRLLGTDITAYMREKHPDLVQSVEKNLVGIAPGGNLFQAYSSFAISNKTPANIANAAQISKDFAAFLVMVGEEGANIRDYILAKQK